jgi:putative aldouronate transport system substrate-binding protein
MKTGIRAAALGLAVSTVFALTGCGTSTTKSSSNSSSEVTYTVFTGSTGTAPTANNRMLQLIKKKLGVNLKIEMLVGDIKTKTGTMIAGGIYDDIMGYTEDLCKAGAFIPLDKYLTSDEYPNLKKLYAKYLIKMKDPNHENHIYCMPPYGATTGETHNFFPNGTACWIQKAVLKEAGYPKIKTLDQYFTVIEQYQKKHPTIDGKKTIGFEILADSNRMYALYNEPAFLAGHPNDGGVIVDKSGDTYKADIFFDKDTSKKYFKKLNEEYLKGIVDKEAFTLNYDQYISKISSGVVLGVCDQEWNFGSAVSELTSEKKYWQTYVGLPLTWDSSIRDEYLDRPDATINIGTGFGISSKAKDPDAIMHLFDTLLSEDWQKTLQWGIKDVDYEVDSKGHFYRTQAQRDAQADANWATTYELPSFFNMSPKIEGTYSDGNAASAGGQVSEWQATLTDVDKEVLKAYNATTWKDLYSEPVQQPAYYPCWQISVKSGSDAAVEQQKLNDLALEYLPQCVTAAKSNYDSVWSKYYSAIHKTDIDSYLKVENAGIQYRLKQWASYVTK